MGCGSASHIICLCWKSQGQKKKKMNHVSSDPLKKCSCSASLSQLLPHAYLGVRAFLPPARRQVWVVKQQERLVVHPCLGWGPGCCSDSRHSTAAKALQPWPYPYSVGSQCPNGKGHAKYPHHLPTSPPKPLPQAFLGKLREVVVRIERETVVEYLSTKTKMFIHQLLFLVLKNK